MKLNITLTEPVLINDDFEEQLAAHIELISPGIASADVTVSYADNGNYLVEYRSHSSEEINNEN